MFSTLFFFFLIKDLIKGKTCGYCKEIINILLKAVNINCQYNYLKKVS